MKEIRVQIRRPQSLLTLGLVVLITGLVLGFQQEPTNQSGQSGKMLNEPVNEAPAQRFDRSFESFAPTVKKVSPAVVRIVTALKFDSPADLANGGQDPFGR